MIGILIALYEEAIPLLPALSFYRIQGVGQYNGFLLGRPVSLYLCGPGIKKRTQLFKWLKQHKFSSIINIGYAGALTREFEIGETCEISSLGKVGEQNVSLSQEEKFHLLTVDEPVFSYDDKEDLFLTTHAQLVDMEAYKIAQILLESGFELSMFRAIKLIGDLPGDALYLLNEKLFRNFFSSRYIVDKLRIILKTGIKNSWFLYRRKKFLQKKLKASLKNALKKL